MLDLILVVAAVGLLIWVFSLLPIPAPFQKVILVVGIIIVVVALLKFLFGIDLLAHMRGILH
jgi:hypothetical protein